MAFDFNNIPFKKKESDPFHYSPPYTPGAGNSFSQDSQGAGPTSNPLGSSGFQNMPKKRHDHSPIQKPNFLDMPNVYEPPRVKRTHTPISIPWRIVIPVILAIAVLTFLYMNRHAITSFLSQLVSWIIVIAVLAAIFKLMLFPGGRGRR